MNVHRDDGDTQPRHFKRVEDFVRFIKDHPKKGAEMSEFTVQALWRFWEEHAMIDTLTDDPIRSLVNRYAVRLGFRGNGPPAWTHFNFQGEQAYP